MSCRGAAGYRFLARNDRWKGSLKKNRVPPQFTDLPPEQARAMLATRELPKGPVMKQLLEWLTKLEIADRARND